MKIKINAKTRINGIVVPKMNKLPGMLQKKPKIINSPSSFLMMVPQSLGHRRNAAKKIKVKAMFLT